MGGRGDRGAGRAPPCSLLPFLTDAVPAAAKAAAREVGLGAVAVLAVVADVDDVAAVVPVA